MAEIRILPDLTALSRAAANMLMLQAGDAVSARGVFHLALSGGSTPKGLYTLLATDESFAHQMPWANIHFWWGDERHVPPDHTDSNYRLAAETLLSRVPVPPDHVHRIRAELTDPAQAAAEYEAELRAVLSAGANTLPRFDLVLLGMGSEGHTASLFPGTRALHSDRLVAANWVGKLFTWRITLTAPVLNHARAVLFLVAGADKALALKGVLEGPYEPEQLPAQIVRPADGTVTWLLDPGAASTLRTAK